MTLRNNQFGFRTGLSVSNGLTLLNDIICYSKYVTFHGIYIWVPAGITLSLVLVMHLWATLGCDVFSCHSNLVNHVRGSMSAPSRKSVAHRPLCA